MKNNARLMLDIMFGKSLLTFQRAGYDADGDAEGIYNVNFEDVDENMACTIILPEIKNGKKTKSFISIPLDLDIIEGMDDLMKLVAAFTYPRDDIYFRVYQRKPKKLTHEYFLGCDREYIGSA